jgi:hypothetical protein
VEIGEGSRRAYILDETQRLQLVSDAELLRQEWASWHLLELLAQVCCCVVVFIVGDSIYKY